MRFLSRAVLFTYIPITRLTGRLLFGRAIVCLIRAIACSPFRNRLQSQKVRLVGAVD